MKQKVLFLLFTLFGLSVAAQEVSHQLVVWGTDDSKLVTMLLSDNPEIVFTGDELVVTGKDVEARYATTTVSHWNFEEAGQSSISDAKAEKDDAMLFTEEGLLFTASAENLNVQIFTIDGKLVKAFTVQAGATQQVSLSELPKGVNIINANGVSYKIIRK